MLQKGAIGVFDSGYGGLTVLKEFQKVLPQYDFFYLGDNSRAPYGSRSFDVVYEYTKECVYELFNKGCNLVILACNTASAKALRTIQQNDLPKDFPDRRVLGVIRPTVEVINNLSKTKHVGVLGTSGTIQSESYPIEINKLFPAIKVTSQACPMWVPLVENEEYDQEGADYFIEKYLKQLLQKDSKIDTIILGCTHYPVLQNKIEDFLPSNINIIAQGSYVAESLKDYLHRHPEIDSMCTKGGKTSYFTTENPKKFSQSASIFLGKEIDAEHLSF